MAWFAQNDLFMACSPSQGQRGSIPRKGVVWPCIPCERRDRWHPGGEPKIQVFRLDLGLSGPKKTMLTYQDGSQEKLMSISSLIPKEPTHLPLSSHCILSSLGKTPNVRCHLLIHNSNLAAVSTHVGAWQN